MAKFTSNNQPENRGRTKGSPNKRSQFTDTMTATALEKLDEALIDGQAWAIETVLKRTHPTLKAITPEDSIDAEFLRLKMKELGEFEDRLKALEGYRANEN